MHAAVRHGTPNITVPSEDLRGELLDQASDVNFSHLMKTVSRSATHPALYSLGILHHILCLILLCWHSLNQYL